MTDPANVEKVKAWVAGLTPVQEIHCDQYGDDPASPSWALVQLEPEPRRLLDFIDQSGGAPNDHSAIADYLDATEAAGQIVGIACGFYRHPERAAADTATNELGQRVKEVRDKALEPIIEKLDALAIKLHGIDPSTSRGEHLRRILRSLDVWLGASASLDDDAEDVPF